MKRYLQRAIDDYKRHTEVEVKSVAAVRKAVVEAVRVATTMSVNMKKKTKRIGAVLLAENHLNSKEKSLISTKKAGQEDAQRRNKNT